MTMKFYYLLKNKVLILFFIFIPINLFALNWNADNQQEFVYYCIKNIGSDPQITSRFTLQELTDVCECVKNYYQNTYTFPDFIEMMNNPTDKSKAEAFNAMYQCTSFILVNKSNKRI